MSDDDHDDRGRGDLEAWADFEDLDDFHDFGDVDDLEERQAPQPPPAPQAPRAPEPGRPEGTSGVRIVGAQEARAAYEAAQDERRRGREERAERRIPPGTTPAAGFPRSDDDAPPPRVRGQFLGEPPGEPEGPVTTGVELPHWREPPSGEVPRLLDRGDEERSGPQPRFRSDVESDWAEHDVVEELAQAESGMVAGRQPPPPDDDEVFAREVEERRRAVRAARRRVPRPTTAPPRRTGEATPPGVPTSEAPVTPGGPREEVRPEARRGEGMLEPGLPEPPPLAPRGPGRDLPTAIVTAASVVVLVLLFFTWGRGPTAVLVAVITTLAAAEMYAALRARGYRPATPVGLAGTAGLVLASYDRGFEAWPLVFGLAAITTLLWFLIRAEDARPTVNAALTFLPLAYVGTLGGFGGLLLAFPNGIGMLWGVALAGVAYDVFGWAVGSRVGTQRIAPRVSPNKTLEGLVGGMLAALLVSVIVTRAIHPWDLTSAAILGLLVAVAAPLGDLCESMVKRDMGIKDFSGLLPGHGGVMDRFDAILFSLPVTFYLVRVLDLV